MLSLNQTIAKLARNRANWEGLVRSGKLTEGPVAPATTPLVETQGFGSNPGALRMFSYCPPQMPANPALVVTLHGCTQTAAGYNLGTGWSKLAERYGFALLLPEQRRSNNPNSCFNWFQDGDVQRDRGEALSIRQMIEKMVVENNIDRSRIFINGLSAGGAMTSAMLACYPEVFAGGAIIAGLPYGAAGNAQQAFESMFQSPPRSAADWGDRVRGASSHNGPWPRISVWHGGADKTVVPANASELLKQWTDVHGLPTSPTFVTTVDGQERRVWVDGAGEDTIESYTIAQMAHGTPIATQDSDRGCGAVGPFFFDVGISSSHRIAEFFGLTRDVPAASARRTAARPRSLLPEDTSPRPTVLEGEILEKDATDGKHAPDAPSLPHQIGTVITKALRAAGLMKDR